MLRNVRDARAYIGMMLYVVSLTSLFKIVGNRGGDAAAAARALAQSTMLTRLATAASKAWAGERCVGIEPQH